MEKTIQNINPIKTESSEITDKIEVYNLAKIFNEEQISDFNLIRFIVKPDQLSDLDQHKVKEYWYIAKGQGALYINGEEVLAKEGETYFFDSFVTHQIKNKSKESNLEILSIWW